ncbi:MAG: hypothetical protein E7474_12365 [Ruminococcaceae bacterium]|nr:hypothetical protein [Oscillospiraceae bacterium]
MKKKLTAILLFIALLASVLAGCNESQPSAPTQQPSAAPAATGQPAAKPANTPSASPEPSMVPNPDVEKVYQEALLAYEPVMEQNCDVIYNGISVEMDYPFVSSGVMEVSSMERGKLLQYLGYTFEDINGDDIPELLIGTIPDGTAEVPETQLFLSGYTCKDGEPVCFLEGWARSVYEYLGDGRFFHYGSGGYAYSGFGTFHISEDGTELIAEEWYFSDTKGPDNSEIAYFHNTTGEWDKDASEELDLDNDAFWALSNEYDTELEMLNLMPFSAYTYTGFIAQPLECKVRADFFDEAAHQYVQYDYDDASEFFDPDETFECTVLFRSEKGVKDFTLLALTLSGTDANGQAAFDAVEVFSVPELRAGVPLMVPMNFPGDIPSNGFSYTDTDATVETFTIGTSGRDGSLVIVPLD